MNDAERVAKYVKFLREYGERHWWDSVSDWFVLDLLADVQRVAEGGTSEEFDESEWNV